MQPQPSLKYGEQSTVIVLPQNILSSVPENNSYINRDKTVYKCYTTPITIALASTLCDIHTSRQIEACLV